MRWFIAALLLGVCAPACPAAPASRGPGHALIHGVEYLSLNDWAARRHYALRWTNGGKDLELTREKSRLRFANDSNLSSINGVNVLLSWPMFARGGVAYLATLDLDKVLDPILFPAPPQPPKITTICLDPGHGGKDPGTIDGSNQEKKMTLLLAREVARQLKDLGYKTILTRTRDTFVDRPSRPAAANQAHADLFLSFHYNFSDDRSVNGLETYCVTPLGANSTNARGDAPTTFAVQGNNQDARNILLAHQIQKALVRELGVEDRGVHRARFEVLRGISMPGVLIEGGFLSNQAETGRILDAKARSKMARAIVDGIEAYRRLAARP